MVDFQEGRILYWLCLCLGILLFGQVIMGVVLGGDGDEDFVAECGGDVAAHGNNCQL